MENYSVVLFIMGLMIALSALSDRVKLPYPVLLVAAGIAVGFLPNMSRVEIAPDIVLLLFLPPLLYDAAFNISFGEFKTHISTISSLALSLVFLTAIGIAIVARYLIPGMDWPLSFVLGAILSATDAVASISISKSLTLPSKTNTILEGESLINDASALIVYRYALAAVGGTAFVLWKASLQFVWLMGGGFAIGFAASKLLQVILRQVRTNKEVAMSFMLLFPFVTYQLSEMVHVSGVIAVVILGFGIARLSKERFPEEAKMQVDIIWGIIVFLLNGLIFILMGLQLPYVIKDLEPGQLVPFTGYAFIITIVALLLRMSRVFWQQFSLVRIVSKGHRYIKEDALLDTPTSLIISWSGMRGIVSIAIAIGLPETLPDGTPFPHRSAIVFISVAVVMFTIIGQGLTLPMVAKMLKKKDPVQQ